MKSVNRKSGILYRVFDYAFDQVLRLVSHFIRKSSESVFFLPSKNSINDRYDIVNCHSDNALFLANILISSPEYASFKISVVYFDENQLGKYLDFCRPFHSERIVFVLYSKRLAFKKAFVHSKYIFTDDYYEQFRYRVKNQYIVCLSYYPFPFKDDFYKFTRYGGYNRMLHSQKVINHTFDYHLSVSDLASCLLSKDSQIFYPKFLSLGFPRNDVFYSSTQSMKEDFLRKLSFSGQEKIICYTPTHRDYESPLRIFYDASCAVNRTIWGDVSEDTLMRLDEMLQANNSIIIAKTHPVQIQTNNITSYNSKRVFLFSDIENTVNVSLYDILAMSDMLITDYTTTVFDFLNADKPIVFYCYDYDKYVSTRGFFINPITPLCPGKFTYTLDELIDEIDSIIKNGDNEADKRRFLSELIIRYHDGYSSKRILNYFFNNS